MNLPQKIYTEKELTRAKTKAKLGGWLQGGGVVLGGAILWNLIGWIPVVIGVGAVGYGLVKFMGRGKDEGEGEEGA